MTACIFSACLKGYDRVCMGVNIKEYIKILESVSKHGHRLICLICGTETPTLAGKGLCSNCENVLYVSRVALLKSNRQLVNYLDGINAMVNTNYRQALKLYDYLYAASRETALLYAQALLCIRASNYEASLMSYTGGSIIGENASHRARSDQLMTKAKLLLNKAAYAYQKSLANAETKNARYMLILIRLKLKDFKAAQESLELLSKQGDEYLTNYARMIFYSAIGDFKDSLIYTDALAKPDSFSINSMYYAALAAMERKRLKDAKRLLTILSKTSRSSNVDALMKDIESLETV